MAAVTAADRGDPVRGADLQGSDSGGTRQRRRRRRGGIRGNERLAGWLFVAPVVVILGLFLLLPILLALWVSLTDWNGQGSPFRSEVPFVGADNYTRLFTEDGLARRDFMTSIRNNIYFVAIVVPAQTALALFLAIVVNNKMLRGRTFFRTAFFFPSVTTLGRDQRAVPVPVRQLRRGQRRAGGVRHRRPDVVLRLPWRAAHRLRTRSVWTPRRRRSRVADRSASPGGTGSPARASR